MDRLEHELRQGLSSVPAPPELWERLQAYRRTPPRKTNQKLVWAMATAVILITASLSSVYRGSLASDESLAVQMLSGDSQRIAFHCQNPAQLRAWVRARTGLDLPLRAGSSSSIQLIGAQTIDGRRAVEVAYRAGNRDAVLVVSRAGAWPANLPHNRVSGNVSSWVMDGQRYTLACNDPADFQLACRLCHLD